MKTEKQFGFLFWPQQYLSLDHRVFCYPQSLDLSGGFTVIRNYCSQLFTIVHNCLKLLTIIHYYLQQWNIALQLFTIIDTRVGPLSSHAAVRCGEATGSRRAVLDEGNAAIYCWIQTKRQILWFSRRESTNFRSFEWSFSKSLLKEREILAFSCDRNNNAAIYSIWHR